MMCQNCPDVRDTHGAVYGILSPGRNDTRGYVETFAQIEKIFLKNY